MGRVKMMGPKVPTADLRTAKPPAKERAPIYTTPGFKEWREAVVARAGRRCQEVEAGVRCPIGEPSHRVYADHIIELEDGGAPYDLANGQCLCSSHHNKKTYKARMARLARQAGHP